MSGPRPGWLDRPQQTRLRKLLFKVHLWVGLALGVYIVVISVSGSIAVFRPDVSRWLIPREVETVGEVHLDADSLEAAVAVEYPEHRLVAASTPRTPESLVQVRLERDGVEIARLVDPYTGRVVGDPYPPVVRWMEWTVRLHDDLLGGDVGRKVNSAAGLLVVVLVVTGAVIWWPGRRRWPLGLVPRRGPSTPPLVWQLHAMLGFWGGTLLLIWAATGFYFGYPWPVESVMDLLDENPDDFERPGEGLLLALIRLHFGRFGGLGIKTTWALLGLVPAVLFITAFMTWWRRVVKRRLATRRPRISLGRAAPEGR